MSEESSFRRELRTTDISSEFVMRARPAWRDLLIIFVGTWAAVFVAETVESAVLPFLGELHFLSLSLIPLAFATGMVAHRLLWEWQPSLGECAGIAARAFLPLLAILALTRLAIAVGFVILLLPALAAFILLALAPVILMAERRPIPSCMIASVERLLPHILKILGAYIVFLLVFVAGVFLMVIVSVLFIGFLPDDGTREAVLDAGLSAVASLLHTSYAVAIYMALSRFEETQGRPLHE